MDLLLTQMKGGLGRIWALLPGNLTVYYQPAARFACGRLVLRLLCRFHICISVYLCVRTYHMCDNYVMYIVAMRPYFSRPWQLRLLLCVAAMSSLPQLRLRDGY